MTVSHTHDFENELEAHLEGCASCRQVLEEQAMIGEGLRSLPTLEPSPAAYDKLMQTLAVEHVHYLQHASPATAPPPTPMFLMPYLKESAPHIGTLTALSTAATGPLPMIQSARRRPRHGVMNPVAIIGLAAAFLMVLMTGGLTTLLLMANRGIPAPSVTNTSINNPAQVSLASYSATSTHFHVTSAVANRDAIYYSARGDGATGWMLQRFDTSSKITTPLLKQERDSELIVLASNTDWLTWLELGPSKTLSGQHGSHPQDFHTRSWSLNALYLGQAPGSDNPAPVTLQKGSFDESTAPTWVHTPIQGLWFIQNRLLVTTIDDKGSPHLLSYRLTPQKVDKPTQIAPTAANHLPSGHILTSPTADSSGSHIYWSEEWQSDDGVLHSNLWAQQTLTGAPRHAGKWVPLSSAKTYELRSDGMSFHPQVVNETLFFLSTNPNDFTDAPQPTAQASGGTSPTAATAPDPAATGQHSSTPTATVTQRMDMTLNPTQADELIQGTLLSYSPLGTQPVAQENNSQEFAPQSGSRFLLWQNNGKGFEMYDAVARVSVPVSNAIPKDALFLTVNGDSVVWMAKDDNTKVSSTNPTVTFSMFNWPTAATA